MFNIFTLGVYTRLNSMVTITHMIPTSMSMGIFVVSYKIPQKKLPTNGQGHPPKILWVNLPTARKSRGYRISLEGIAHAYRFVGDSWVSTEFL